MFSPCYFEVNFRRQDEMIQEKVQLAVRFYGLHLMQLPESNEAVLMLAGIFIVRICQLLIEESSN